MKFILKFLALNIVNLCLLQQAFATTAPATMATPTVSLFKTIFGLAVVLGVMAALAWFAKRMAGRQGNSHSVARIVGGVSVGSRERVVVVEVGNRWLVVGVAAGQVNAIANLGKEDGATLSVRTNYAEPKDGIEAAHLQHMPSLLQNGQSFSVWLKQSLNKAYKKHD
ncbi:MULTISPECIES: flagellar biosynthetic protein FliO [Methylotenera]|uniref:flagellar biosynthetic protein FliO n=1 Tax=Methylotenera TaxID=359407 RepID=UPI00036B08A1|nr:MULTISPECIES: flagellar biosynthetic protein FliO [Methylotenera]